MDKTYWVYMLTNCVRSVLYVGVTNDLERRLLEHKEHVSPGFTDRYMVNRLVYFEETMDVSAAIVKRKATEKME